MLMTTKIDGYRQQAEEYDIVFASCVKNQLGKLGHCCFHLLQEGQMLGHPKYLSPLCHCSHLRIQERTMWFCSCPSSVHAFRVSHSTCGSQDGRNCVKFFNMFSLVLISKMLFLSVVLNHGCRRVTQNHSRCY